LYKLQAASTRPGQEGERLCQKLGTLEITEEIRIWDVAVEFPKIAHCLRFSADYENRWNVIAYSVRM
jgi:hypothetical protein